MHHFFFSLTRSDSKRYDSEPLFRPLFSTLLWGTCWVDIFLYFFSLICFLYCKTSTVIYLSSMWQKLRRVNSIHSFVIPIIQFLFRYCFLLAFCVAPFIFALRGIPFEWQVRTEWFISLLYVSRASSAICHLLHLHLNHFVSFLRSHLLCHWRCFLDPFIHLIVFF